MAVFRASLPLNGDHHSIAGTFTGFGWRETRFRLELRRFQRTDAEPISCFAALTEIEEFWREWTSRARTTARWSDAMLRSLITLGTDPSPTGGIVASVTTSLPEHLGGSRNWDYRFCWLRDATFTLIALMNGGFRKKPPHGESGCAYHGWRARADEIMYGVTGKRQCPMGNDLAKRVSRCEAGTSWQSCCNADANRHLWRDDGCSSSWSPRQSWRQPSQGWELQVQMLRHLKRIWQEPDHGIWEVRGDRQHFVNSKVIAWVALPPRRQDNRTFQARRSG